MLQLTRFSVDRHGNHFELVATAVRRVSFVVKKPHVVQSDRVSLMAAASVGVNCVCPRSVDASRTVVYNPTQSSKDLWLSGLKLGAEVLRDI